MGGFVKADLRGSFPASNVEYMRNGGQKMVGNDCGSVEISFMATFFYFSLIRQTTRKNSATILSEMNFLECL